MNDIIKILIPSIVTIIGFIINIIITRKNIKQDINKLKTNVFINRMEVVPEKTMDLIKKTINIISKTKNDTQESQEFFHEFDEIKSIILAYGSRDAIKIVNSFNKNALKRRNKFDLLCYLTLLFCQVKYDSMGIIINAEEVISCYGTGYDSAKPIISEINNKIVNELDLEKFLLILDNKNKVS